MRSLLLSHWKEALLPCRNPGVAGPQVSPLGPSDAQRSCHQSSLKKAHFSLRSLLIFWSSLTPFSRGLSAQTLLHLSCCLQIQFLCCCQDPSQHSHSRLPVTQPAFPKSFYNYLREPLFQEDKQSCRDEGLWEGTEPSQPPMLRKNIIS